MKQMNGDWTVDKTSGAVIVPIEAGIGVNSNDDEHVILQGVLVGMRNVTEIDNSFGPSKPKEKKMKAGFRVAAATIQHDAKEGKLKQHVGWHCEVEVSVGLCSDNNSLDHFGCGKGSVLPLRSREQHKVLVEQGAVLARF
jgi:hypothetical protein